MVLIVAFAMLFGAVGVRLFQLQLVEPDRYVAYGEDIRFRTNELPAARGAIYDRHGAELVLPVDRYAVVADPLVVLDAESAAQRLSPLLGSSVEELREQLSRDSRFVYLDRDVSVAVFDELRRSPVPGVWVLEEAARYRPAGELAGPVLGSTNIDNEGTGGIELDQNHLLKGEAGSVSFERDGSGRTIAAGGVETVAAVPGTDLALTLDRDLQFAAERIVGDAVSRLGANWGVAVIVEVETGDILAMVSMDRDADTGLSAPSDINRVVSHTVEPGSVMKVVPIAAALHDGKVRADEVVDAPQSIERGGVTRSNEGYEQTGLLTPSEILETSSNTGTDAIASRLEAERFEEWLREFGFGSRTDLRLPGEERGLLRSADLWTEASPSGLAIGYEVAVTPLQLAEAYNIIANDGLAQPFRLVRETRADADSPMVPVELDEARRVLSEPVARQMREFLAGVVDDGTAGLASIEDKGWSAGGKTGTALKTADDGTYEVSDKTKRTTSFTGMAPVADPEVTIVVMLDEPQTETTGGRAAAPVFRDLAVAALSRLGVPPDRPVDAALFEEADPDDVLDYAFEAPTRTEVTQEPEQGTEQQGAAGGQAVAQREPTGVSTTQPGTARAGEVRAEDQFVDVVDVVDVADGASGPEGAGGPAQSPRSEDQWVAGSPESGGAPPDPAP
jgi:cell division protein FtsI (penicillin-binding protein 3)